MGSSLSNHKLYQQQRIQNIIKTSQISSPINNSVEHPKNFRIKTRSISLRSAKDSEISEKIAPKRKSTDLLIDKTIENPEDTQKVVSLWMDTKKLDFDKRQINFFLHGKTEVRVSVLLEAEVLQF